MKKGLRVFLAAVVCVMCILTQSGVKAEASANYQIGDIDRKDGIDAADALLVLKNVVGLQELDDYQQTVADVNKDGNIDTSDALQILGVVVDLQPFTVNVSLNVGDTYTIDKVYDGGSYMWHYTVVPTEGISVEREYLPLPGYDDPMDIPDGDTPEQVYTITADQAGTYKLDLRFTPIGNSQGETAEEVVYIFDVK